MVLSFGPVPARVATPQRLQAAAPGGIWLPHPLQNMTGGGSIGRGVGVPQFVQAYAPGMIPFPQLLQKPDGIDVEKPPGVAPKPPGGGGVHGPPAGGGAPKLQSVLDEVGPAEGLVCGA